MHAADRPDAAWWRARRDLPDLPALVGRRRRRRHRRPARHHRPPAAPARPRRRRRLALARSTPRRRPTPATTSPTTATSTRSSAPSPTPTRMMARAHELGLKVHRRPGAQPLLRRARVVPGRARGRPGLARSARATCSATGRGEHGELPPNNWESVFGGAALDPGHRGRRHAPASGTCTSSTPSSPTSTGSTPRSRAEFESILRFWLDRGVDGFRVDVAHGLIKAQGLPDTEEERTTMLERRRARRRAGHGAPPTRRRASTTRSAARCGTRTASTRSTARWRQMLESYGDARPHPLRRGLGRAAGARGRATSAPTRCTRRSTSTSSTPTWDAAALRAVIDVLAARQPTPSARRRRGCCPTTTSCGTPRASACTAARRGRTASGADDPQPDRALGLRRARAATAAHARAARRRLRLPGRGARPARLTDMPDEFRQDPTFARTARRGDRPRRLPRADAVGRGRAEPRLRPGRQHVAAAARRLRRLRRRPAGGRRRLDPRALPRAAAPRAASCRPRDRLADVRRGVCRRRRRADQRLVPGATGCSSSPTSAPSPSPCRRAPRSSSPLPRSRTASCRPT